MNPEAGLGMWIPSDWGEGAGTKALDPGEGTWSCGLPGDPTLSRVPGEGVPISAVEGEGVTWNSHQNIKFSKFHWKNSTMNFFYYSYFMHLNTWICILSRYACTTFNEFSIPRLTYMYLLGKYMKSCINQDIMYNHVAMFNKLILIFPRYFMDTSFIEQSQ